MIPLTRGDLELTDTGAVERRLSAEGPAAVIHCAGYTRSPACEVEPELARRLNTEVTFQLAEVTARAGIPLVFFSTDLVFDGCRGWYGESEEPNPLGVYARTKREGERAVLAIPGHIVLRTTLNYGVSPTGDRAFNEEMIRAARAGRRLKLFTDEFRCPIAVEETARATWELVSGLHPASTRPRPSGVYHLAGPERLSRWEIGGLVARLNPELRGALEPSSRKDYQGPPRPADASMRCDRIQPWLSRPIPGFTEWVARHEA